MGYVYLTLAVIAEVIGTSALKASEEFTKPLPTALALGGYIFAFYMLTFVFRTVPVGVAYAVWSGLGIALISVIGVFMFQQTLDFAAIAGIVLIVAGVAVINLFSKVTVH